MNDTPKSVPLDLEALRAAAQDMMTIEAAHLVTPTPKATVTVYAEKLLAFIDDLEEARATQEMTAKERNELWDERDSLRAALEEARAENKRLEDDYAEALDVCLERGIENNKLKAVLAAAEQRATVAEARGRMYPIQGGPDIPWHIIAPHRSQAERNHGQTIEGLARRGGLDPTEAVAVLEDRKYERMDRAKALARLKEIVDSDVQVRLDAAEAKVAAVKRLAKDSVLCGDDILDLLNDDPVAHGVDPGELA